MSSLPVVRIVTHCYAEQYPHFAACLCYQLSSLLLEPPKHCIVDVVICRALNDWRTAEVTCYFLDPCGFITVEGGHRVTIRNVRIGVRHLERGELWRRAIGRNLCCPRADSVCVPDYLWFTDVDHCFCDGVLDRLVTTPWPEGASMIFPAQVMIHRDHATGDAETSKLIGPDGTIRPTVAPLDKSLFIAKGYGRAIGGVQIVRGELAQVEGYLRRYPDKWLRPASRPFPDFRDDIAFRKICQEHGPIVRVDLPGVYRIRHSRTTYQ